MGACKIRLTAFRVKCDVMAEPVLALLFPNQIQDLHSEVDDIEKEILP